MQTLEKKETKPKRILGIAVVVMTKNKGLFQKVWMEFTAEDLAWIEVVELGDSQGGRSVHLHDFSVSTNCKNKEIEK